MGLPAIPSAIPIISMNDQIRKLASLVALLPILMPPSAREEFDSVTEGTTRNLEFEKSEVRGQKIEVEL